jgi:hypothetical protein
MLRRPPTGLVVTEIEAPQSALTTFSVGRAAEVIDEGYRTATSWLGR